MQKYSKIMQNTFCFNATFFDYLTLKFILSINAKTVKASKKLFALHNTNLCIILHSKCNLSSKVQ